MEFIFETSRDITMKLDIINKIQKKCLGVSSSSPFDLDTVYSVDMVEFYDVLDTIDQLFRDFGNDENVRFRTKLDKKYFPVLELYLNMFCEPAGCKFTIADGSTPEKPGTWISVKMCVVFK